MIAAELRIGNYFLAGKMTPPEIVYQITFSRLDGYLINGQIPIDHCNPIPLTPAILVDNCGFIDHDNFYSKSWGTNGVEIIKWDDYYKGFLLELGKGRTKLIHDLHTLQNGFHFLTSSELEVKF